MSALEIEFHCLCVFVPDPENQLVHVLMPATGGVGADGRPPHDHPGGADGRPPHDHPGGAAGEHAHVHARHFAWIVHDDLTEDVEMEGWALRLGEERGNPDLSLVPRYPVDGAELVDLNTHTGRPLDPALLLHEKADPRVMARVTLRDGYMLSALSDTEWLMKGQPVRMANRCTWRIDNFAGGPLDWHPLTTTGGGPLDTFDRLNAPDGVRHVHIFHTTPEGRRPAGTSLTFQEVREHFRVYLELYGIRPVDDPHGDLLPDHTDREMLVGVNCPVTKASATRPSAGGTA